MHQSPADAKLEAIRWDRPRLSILDQLLLPHASEYVDIATSADGHRAIVSMQTRGAPAIAIVAALSLAAEISRRDFGSAQQAHDFIVDRLDYLATSRPTAVNLFDAVAKLKAVAASALASQSPAATGASVALAYVDAAEQMLAADVRDNRAIGSHGARYIAARALAQGAGAFKLLTHCNTGALATAGHGTALGIIRSLHQGAHMPAAAAASAAGEAVLDHVYFGETRPYNQGARLTAYELLCEGIPSTLVCDSAVSALLRSDPSIVGVVVGADRVAANGDTANKIGTYQLAIAARFHGREFIVAAPSTSVDLGLASGEGIVIEERDPAEITRAEGFVREALEDGRMVRQTLCVAPEGTRAWNPSFDVTPAELISAIVTEKGVFVKTPGATTYDLAKCLGENN
ncbi:S-methyl-5-thioribose-1-phosphate isomerase [Coemansia interrupta]|uniref:Methylthioribose-1-phosphate isomerase n=1 Tax=Coemansia interrupta TaxID=1126814 RepID=A0A9W8HJ53_9FUNG|nr:S-methyl-5-thioribose-1-phosphate isomerase [Coemansia interrupta]